MYNLNGSMSGTPMLGVDGCAVNASSILTSTASSIATTSNGQQLTVGTTCTSHTPLTPEILNSVMAMTNPLEYSYSTNNPMIISNEISQPSTDSHSSSSGSPFDSPKTSTFAMGRMFSKEAITPTVQQTCSELIKTSLKLSLEMKRKTSTTDSSSIDMPICKKIKEDIDTSDDETSEYEMRLGSRATNPLLTNEDEDRRRRRRERNKIAATKCRMKKRERTNNLISEAGTLDSQNADYKQQLCNLEIERRSLTELLKAHSSNCMRGTRLALPVLNVSIEKFLNQIGSGQQTNQQFLSKSVGQRQQQSPITKSRNATIKITPQRKLQKIPSVSTLKFSNNNNQHNNNNNSNHNNNNNNHNGRQSNQSNESFINSTNMMSPMTVAITTTTNCIPSQMSTNVSSSISECKQTLPSMDMGFCEGRKDTITPTSSYCKSSDCYAMSSPDSGFIKSPVDMGGNYLPTMIIKANYIPNCGTENLLNHHRLDANDSTNGDNGDNSIDFILKSELVDLNDGPYTTVHSANRFLFDGVVEAFDSDIDGTNPNHNHSSIIDDPSTLHLHALTKDHLLLNGITNNNNNINNSNNNNNNNNNNNHNNNNHNNNNHNNNNNNNNSNQINNNNQHHHTHHNGLHSNLMNSNVHLQNFVNNNSNVISTALHSHPSAVIEFNSCHQFMDNSSLLKSDFLSPNCDFLSLANESGDSQFTTDLDSGVTTYTNINNSNGCLA